MEDKAETAVDNALPITDMPAADKLLPKGIELTQLLQVAAMAEQKQNRLEKDITLIKHGLVAIDDEIKQVISLLKNMK